MKTFWIVPSIFGSPVSYETQTPKHAFQLRITGSLLVDFSRGWSQEISLCISAKSGEKTMKRRRKCNKIVKEALGSLSIFFKNGLLYLFILMEGSNLCLWEILKQCFSTNVTTSRGHFGHLWGLFYCLNGKRTPKPSSGCRPEMENVLKWAGWCHGAEHSSTPHTISYTSKALAPHSCRWNPIYNRLNPMHMF